MIRRWLWGPHSPLGFTIAALVILADQGSKLWLLHVYDIAARTKNGPIEPFPLFQLHMVWNPGVSLGLFPQDTTFGRFGLVLFALIVSTALVVWLARATSKLTALSLGLVLGGAIGNAIDRAAYGKVADFFYIDIRWIDIWPIKYMFDYVFNVADVAIVAGVIGLLYESLFGGHKKAGNPLKCSEIAVLPDLRGIRGANLSHKRQTLAWNDRSSICMRDASWRLWWRRA